MCLKIPSKGLRGKCVLYISVICVQNCTYISETGLLYSRSFVVKTSFGHVLSIKQSKRGVFIQQFKIFVKFSTYFLRNVKLYKASIVHWCEQIILYFCFAQCVELGKMVLLRKVSLRSRSIGYGLRGMKRNSSKMLLNLLSGNFQTPGLGFPTEFGYE